MKWDAEKYDSVKAPQIDAGRELIATAEVRETDSVLDIGCGTGKLTVELARLASKGKVVGIDPSKEMLQKAQEVAAGVENLRFVRTGVESIDFVDRFDFAFSNSSLQWVKEQAEAIRRTYRSLRRGGRIAFQLPARDFCVEFFNYSSNAITLLGYERFFLDWRTPWFLPTREEYERLLERACFRNIKVYYREYKLVFSGIGEILEWWSTAGLRPYLAALPEREKEYFKYAVAMQYEQNRTERGLEFGFRRLFASATK
ncbi:MAG TPA: methyltransferase domain-containing protein [Thermodesulfovibrionales bacterium]|nr:methyltransferase domain-containing protein [Thermodesulfovibrionales bacterium]